jgi:hypothetical protein
MRQLVTEEAAISAEIARIRSLALDALRRGWRAEFGRTPPTGLSRDLLGRMIACRSGPSAFMESEIMMGVLRRCQKKGIVALPVFDCAVVKASVAATVKGIMQREFKGVAGLNIEVREEVDATML